LSQKDVRADPVEILCPIRIRINDTKALEVGCCFENRGVNGVSNKLSEIKVNN